MNIWRAQLAGQMSKYSWTCLQTHPRESCEGEAERGRGGGNEGKTRLSISVETKLDLDSLLGSQHRWKCIKVWVLVCNLASIRTPPRQGRHWEIYPRSPKDFPRLKRLGIFFEFGIFVEICNQEKKWLDLFKIFDVFFGNLGLTDCIVTLAKLWPTNWLTDLSSFWYASASKKVFKTQL